MLKHVVQGEKAAEEEVVLLWRLRFLAMADVLDVVAQGAVEAAGEDVGIAQPGVVVRERMLPCDAGVDEAAEKEPRILSRGRHVVDELGPGEDAGVEADEGEPGGLVGTEAEFPERGVASVQVGHVRGLEGHGQKSVTWSAWT